MKLLLLLFLSCYSPSLSSSQKSFSPFSFLGSLFKSAPSWTGARQAKTLHRSPPKQSKKFFRPHLPLGPSFSASQEIPQVVRFQNKLPSADFTSQSKPKLKYPVIRIISHSNFSKPTQSPKHFIKTFPPPTEKNTFVPSFNDFQVTESEFKSTPTVVKLESINTSKGNPDVHYPTSAVGPSDQITTNFVTPQSSFSSYSPNHENGASGPNPGDFPIISLIDEPSVNYYEQVFQNIGPVQDNSNPYYAPEEFNYNQDPIHIDHTDRDEDFLKEINHSVYDDFDILNDSTHFTIIKDTPTTITTTTTTTTTTPKPRTTLSSIFLEANEDKHLKENLPRSIDFKSISSTQDLFKSSGKSKEFTNLVNTIEYKPTDIKPRTRKKGFKKFNENPLESLASLVDCSDGSEKGFCSMTSLYPKGKIEALVEDCNDIIEAFKAVVPENFDALGDNSINVISSEKDLTRPWSWKVYAYKKRQICDSELSFIRPSYALDTEGDWNIILQTDSLLQRISLDTCTKAGYPCPGLAECGKKSSCVQRYNHQFLLSLPTSISSTPSCPTIRAFKFPSGCVCHAEIKNEQDLNTDTETTSIL